MLQRTFPHIEALRVKNYRALRDVELKKITPLSAFLGPNGSGKSTLFDIFAFLAECFTVGLRSACDMSRGLRSANVHRRCEESTIFWRRVRSWDIFGWKATLNSEIH